MEGIGVKFTPGIGGHLLEIASLRWQTIFLISASFRINSILFTKVCIYVTSVHCGDGS